MAGQLSRQAPRSAAQVRASQPRPPGPLCGRAVLCLESQSSPASRQPLCLRGRALPPLTNPSRRDQPRRHQARVLHVAMPSPQPMLRPAAQRPTSVEWRLRGSRSPQPWFRPLPAQSTRLRIPRKNPRPTRVGRPRAPWMWTSHSRAAWRRQVVPWPRQRLPLSRPGKQAPRPSLKMGRQLSEPTTEGNREPRVVAGPRPSQNGLVPRLRWER